MDVDTSYSKPVLSGDYATFYELFAAAAATFPEIEAYVHRGERIS
jgi:hypothetical protein